MVDYPFFADVRAPGLNADHPITSGVPQVTVSWASPMTIDSELNAERDIVELMRSTEGAWTSESMDVLPRVTDTGISDWPVEGNTGSQLLAASISGRFTSWFAGKPSPLLSGSDDSHGEQAQIEPNAPQDDLTVGGVIERSPESARLVLYASNDFLTDQILGTMSSMTGAQYLGPLEMIANTLDWALEDGGLLGIRSHSHFNRALLPLEKDEQLFWEYLNYALALAILLVIALWQRQRRIGRQQRYLEQLGESA